MSTLSVVDEAPNRRTQLVESAASRVTSNPSPAGGMSNTMITTAARARFHGQTLGSHWIMPTKTPRMKPAFKGTVCTSLQTEGRSSVVPFPTTVITATSEKISPIFLNATASSTLRDTTPSSINATNEGVSSVAPNATASSTFRDTTSSGINGTSEVISPTTLNATVSSALQDTTPSAINATSEGVSPITLNETASSTLRDTTPSGTDIFVPIATDPAPYMVGPKDGHPIPRTGIAANVTKPIATNKFYANLFLGDQTDSVWTHPYSIRWVKGLNNVKSWGMSITHTERSLVTYGPGDPASYYINPTGVDSLIFSAEELGSTTVLTSDSHQAFSVNANLAPSANAIPLLTMPLVQGMGFVTAIYSSATPLIESAVFFKALSPLSVSNGISRTTATLQDGTQWVIYVIPDDSKSSPKIALRNSHAVQISSGFSGIIQVAKLDGGNSASVYDSSAGAYAVAGAVSGTVISQFTKSVTGTTTASYSLSWTKHGDISKTLLMFALPHHIQALDQASVAFMTDITLQTTTKGIATGMLADSWTMIEQLASDMSFAPYSPSSGTVTKLPAAAVSLIAQTAAEELGEDISAQTNLDTMYFSGKALAKFAAIIYTAHDLANAPSIAAAGLVKLKAAYDVFVQNHQQNRLVYDTVWKGAVSSAGYRDIGADFGGTAYNDHHFHYGYFVYTAAVITYLDPSWRQNNQNRAWVNMLVRDYANSATNDAYYPFSRNFDWYHGHSWAKGLFQSDAGKGNTNSCHPFLGVSRMKCKEKRANMVLCDTDQESSSEDSFASYAVKMWGKVSGDGNMEARGDLMLAIQARSFSNYFLMQSTNENHPANFINNKATGILFEGKVDHTTYFGTKAEYIEGIHMLPVMPNTGLTRSPTFVQQEWTTYFDNNRVNAVTDGWRGVLMANLAFIDPKTSWRFFADRNFNPAHLDGGASRTWYLALAAALGGVS
ncbi:hypothetical protein FKW77_005506 [Venturia effusa]|uniref:glucan endo-1,3-beta-D-glucosidase n=1 Tax=Venturia effusa TaxID=50376 RepID=A0A517L7D5_9PEZI|nr:hypothetical protein FKW77_005506 [Venturia effusa]